MKMKETLKFLKFGLIGVASVTAISTLAISCNEKKNETANNNNSNNTQTPGDTTKPETPVDAETKNKLEGAKKQFTVAAKSFDRTKVRANEITKENFNNYFTLNGTLTGFTYTLTKLETNGEHGLTVYYNIELNKHTIESSFGFDGFKGLNLIDYDYHIEKDFYSIALDKEHLNTIAFKEQGYSNPEITNQLGWTLKFDNKSNYELTKTGKYIIFNEKKMNVWKIKFVIEKPISVGEVHGYPAEVPFTETGKKYHNENGGFQIAIVDGVNELV